MTPALGSMSGCEADVLPFAERPQDALRPTQLGQGPPLDLANTLTREAEALPDLFEGLGLSMRLADPEAKAKDLLFLWAEPLQSALHLPG